VPRDFSFFVKNQSYADLFGKLISWLFWFSGLNPKEESRGTDPSEIPHCRYPPNPSDPPSRLLIFRLDGAAETNLNKSTSCPNPRKSGSSVPNPVPTPSKPRR
jgi:hypothetical protein